MLDDQSLIGAAQAGAPGAFESLVERHRRGVVDFFCRMSRDRDIAEDCAQEVFAKLARHLDRFEPRAKFTTFLYCVARNLWIDRVRAGAARRYISLDAASGESGTTLNDTLPSPVGDPLAALEREEGIDGLRRAVGALPEALRQVVVLAVQHELGYHAVGAILQIPVGTVKSRIHTARALLRRMLVPAAAMSA